MSIDKQGLSESSYWEQRANAGYSRLGWVNAIEPLNKMVELAGLQGNEIVVDAGTGSQAILDALAPHLKTGRIFGFDISAGMLQRKEGVLPSNAALFLGDIYHLPLVSNSVDLITSRMVYHNLNNTAKALEEAKRVLVPGGKLIVCEYVTPEDTLAWEHEKVVFDIKEKGRNLWTGNQLLREIAAQWEEGRVSNGRVSLDFAFLKGYSVKDWMSKSSLPEDKQQQVVDIYLKATPEVVKAMNINYTDDGDALVDRHFAYVVARKDK